MTPHVSGGRSHVMAAARAGFSQHLVWPGSDACFLLLKAPAVKHSSHTHTTNTHTKTFQMDQPSQPAPAERVTTRRSASSCTA